MQNTVVDSCTMGGMAVSDLQAVYVIKLRDRPIFRTDLQIRTTFGFGWVGDFAEMGCSDFQWRKKSVHLEIPFYSIISSNCSFILKLFFPSSYKYNYSHC